MKKTLFKKFLGTLEEYDVFGFLFLTFIVPIIAVVIGTIIYSVIGHFVWLLALFVILLVFYWRVD